MLWCSDIERLRRLSIPTDNFPEENVTKINPQTADYEIQGEDLGRDFHSSDVHLLWLSSNGKSKMVTPAAESAIWSVAFYEGRQLSFGNIFG